MKKRLDDDVEEFEHSIFDTFSNEKLVRAVRKLILKSGKKKSNLMATLSFMHPKYKNELEKDDDLQFIYSLLSSAGINGAFMNFYPPGGNFKFHRDHFLSKRKWQLQARPRRRGGAIKTICAQGRRRPSYVPIMQRRRALEAN